MIRKMYEHLGLLARGKIDGLGHRGQAQKKGLRRRRQRWDADGVLDRVGIWWRDCAMDIVSDTPRTDAAAGAAMKEMK